MYLSVGQVVVSNQSVHNLGINREYVMSIIIQSHNYTINFDNVNYFRQCNAREHGVSERFYNEQTSEEERGTTFKMNNGRSVMITCSYDEVVAHLREWTNMAYSPADILIELEYGDDTVDESSNIERVMEGIADEIVAVARN
jgi:hypothetical protein